METLFVDVNWMAVIVGAVVAFVVGWVWYSPRMFATKWLAGIKISPSDNTPMMPALLTQAFGTFLLSLVIGVTAATNDLYFAILITLTLVVTIKANGLFSQKSHYAIAVETGYIIVMVIIMILIQGAL